MDSRLWCVTVSIKHKGVVTVVCDGCDGRWVGMWCVTVSIGHEGVVCDSVWWRERELYRERNVKKVKKKSGKNKIFAYLFLFIINNLWHHDSITVEQTIEPVTRDPVIFLVRTTVQILKYYLKLWIIFVNSFTFTQENLLNFIIWIASIFLNLVYMLMW